MRFFTFILFNYCTALSFQEKFKFKSKFWLLRYNNAGSLLTTNVSSFEELHTYILPNFDITDHQFYLVVIYDDRSNKHTKNYLFIIYVHVSIHNHN